MGRLIIVLIAAVGTVWKIDPVMRPYIDAGMTFLFACLMFYLGDIVNGWLDRWAAKPHWKKVTRPTSRSRPRRQRPRHGGASTPLLTR